MKPILFTNVQIFDGTGRNRFPGQVRVVGNRIDAVVEGGENIVSEGAEILDGRGMTLLPGMVEAHAHLTWPSSVEQVLNTMRLPPEEHLLVIMAFPTTRSDAMHAICSSSSSCSASLRSKPWLPRRSLAAS